MAKTIKEYEFVSVINDNFRYGIPDIRKLNDIIEITYQDGSREYRIYLDNEPITAFVAVPFDPIMLIILKKCTWTSDNCDNNGIGKSVKSGKDDKYLNEVLEQYGYKDYMYKIVTIENDEYRDVIMKNCDEKRKEFKRKNNL